MRDQYGINRLKLKRLREQHGLSWLGLDKKAALGWGTTRRCEMGYGGITVETLIRISEALGIEPSFFLE